jgi:cobalt-zinc-cadmium efflux system outer membrane protein
MRVGLGEVLLAVCMVLGTMMALAGEAAQAGQPAGSVPAAPTRDGQAPGQDLDEILSLARRLSPVIAAAALESQAAEAAAHSAGALDDPELKLSVEDATRTRSGLPGRPGTLIFAIEQRFPWWGKRRLHRSVAEADAARAQATARMVRAELELRIKQAFTDAWLASAAIAVTAQIASDLRTTADAMVERYAVGLAGQGEVSEAELALSTTLIDEQRLEAELASAKGRLNALLNRPPHSPLGDPAALPPTPAAELNWNALLERALADSPALAELRSEMASAEGNRGLAAAAWYPDLTAGVGVVEGLSGGEDAYEASLGITIPLQWGARDARISEASARLAAAEHRLRGAERELEASLSTALHALEAERFRARLVSGPDLRQAEAALAAAEAAYPVGRAGIADVLRSRRRVGELLLEHLRSQAAQQRLLAEIEFLIGGEL